MFGTIIMDAYRESETLEIADALEDLCSPNDHYGWASAGIYCFWDYYIEEVLYIGLASDLCVRFKQHNGLLPLDPDCCKESYIKNYFSCNERLGYSIFVQSSLSQPLTFRNKSKYKKYAKQHNSPIADLLSEDGKNDIKRVEGILIESYRQKHGHFPPWNSVGGSIEGQKRVMPNNINIVQSFCTPDWYERSPIISRSTLRELSANPEYEAYENFLHAARMYMLIFGMDYPDALKYTIEHDSFDYYTKMKEAGYLNKRLIF